MGACSKSAINLGADFLSVFHKTSTQTIQNIRSYTVIIRKLSKNEFISFSLKALLSIP